MAVQTADTTDREMVLSRTFNAPRELVWKVWTDPAHIGNWWGPQGFTNTTHSIEVKPGGKWSHTMHGPDGKDYPNCIVFHEIEPPSLLSYSHVGEDGDDGDTVNFSTVVTFEADGDKTHLTMKSIFPTAEMLQHVVEKYGALEGARQMLERLDAYLAAQ